MYSSHMGVRTWVQGDLAKAFSKIPSISGYIKQSSENFSEVFRIFFDDGIFYLMLERL